MDLDQAQPEAGAARPKLTAEHISAKLREVALFKGLGDEDLQEILMISESTQFEAGEYVFVEGESGDHFYIIVHGSIELRKASGAEERKLAVLRSGQAFGEMALLNQTPRSASAFALEDTYMLSVSRDAFGEILGGDSLSVRLLKNLSKALWATSVRLASQQTVVANDVDSDTGYETLSEFNRLLRARVLPRVTPRVSGYDISASTLAPRQGAGSTSWDWFVLTDGRPAFCVLRSVKVDVFAAQRIAAARLLLRTLAADRHTSLGELGTKVSRGLRAGWVEGLSGSVAVGLVALSDGAAEWVSAGPMTGVLARATQEAQSLVLGAPPWGEDTEHLYHSRTVPLGNRDRIVCITGRHNDPAGSVDRLVQGYVSNSRDALAKLLGGMEPAEPGNPDAADVSAVVITRTSREA